MNIWITLLICGGFAAFTYAEEAETRLIRVVATTEEQLKFIEELEIEGVDIWLHGAVGSPIDIATTKSSFPLITKVLKEEGVEYKIVIHNIQNKIREEMKENIEAKHAVRRSLRKRKESLDDIHNYYASLSEIYKWLAKVEQANKDVVRVVTIGKSHEGKDMKVIKINEGKSKINKKIWIDGGIHAREWISPSTVLYLINQLLKEENAKLMQDYEWHILPVFNVDGYVHSHRGDETARLWRKNRRLNLVYTSAYNKTVEVYGVDLNRNFNCSWMENGSSDLQTSQIYAGPEPFSEPETRAVRDYLTSKSENMILYLSFHSYSELILTPYSFKWEHPENQEDIERVCNATVAAIESVRGTKYEYGPPTHILYAASGSSYDWAKEKLGIPYSFVFELSPSNWDDGGFILKPESIIPVGKEIWEGMKALFSEIQK